MDYTEETPIEQYELFEMADMESDRVRQSELVSMNAVHLAYKLDSLGLSSTLDGMRDATGRPLTASCLPPELAEALLAYLTEYETDMHNASRRAEELHEQKARDEARLESLTEKVERTKSSVAYYSEQSSAELRAFRETLQQHATQNKQRNRDIADVVRKRERAELDARRTQMEIDRLRKIQKSVR